MFTLGSSLLTSLSKEERLDLIRDFTMAEIEEALAASDNMKAPGPDGVNTGVLRVLWPVIKDEVWQFFTFFHRDLLIPVGYNSSFIALIPKVTNPSLPSQFRPISLMNSIMKLLTKVLARRLKCVMNPLVSPCQSAFIQGRHISDSILIASEIIHSLQTKNSVGVVLKIDFEKAFDKIKWDFVFEVLRSMNFDPKWVDWISAVFHSSKISILVNGSPSPEFSPSQGLRQGDPLSPLIFNLVGEVLAKMLEKAAQSKIIQGITLPNCENPITHLQFADDVVLFSAPDTSSIIGIKRVLQCFQIISGLKINFSKSALYGYGQKSEKTEAWAHFLGCEVGKGPLKYLGATLGSPPSSINYWTPLLNKLQSKIQSYDSSTLSIAGRIVLLKAAIDSIPTYWFNLFKIPSGVVKRIEKMRRLFLWGGTSGTGAKRKIHLLNWEKICSPKSRGGLGLVPIQLRNKVLLAKWVWRAYKERGFFWNKIMVERYGRGWNYDLNLLNSSSCSPIVKSIVNAQMIPPVASLMSRKNFKWSLRNGTQILFWEDWWCEDEPLCSKFNNLYSLAFQQHLSVKDFLYLWETNRNGGNLWLANPLNSLTSEYEGLVKVMESISLKDGDDILLWDHAHGQFSTSECYLEVSKLSNFPTLDKRFWDLIWSVKAPPKILYFLWRIQWNIVPTRNFLKLRIKGLIDICPWCGLHPETSSHLFWECELSSWVWDFISAWWSFPTLRSHSASFSLSRLLLFKVSDSSRRIWQLVIAAALWSLWLARNELVFSKVRVERHVLIELLHIRISKWGKASGLLEYGDTPLWKVHPQGAIALHTFKVGNNFWRHKRQCFDVVCAVDGAWGLISETMYGGGIGGTIHDNKGSLILSFSGPVHSSSPISAEIEGILFLFQCLKHKCFHDKRIVICSDSVVAVNAFNKGLHLEFPAIATSFHFQSLINTTIFIQFVPRLLNHNADSLAKKGLARPSMAAHWTVFGP